ncbi:MAG: glutamate formimidoyltransferase [Nitrospira sp.]|jgi:glutamate formiminotransferase/formiminotetrahydrofolate cyclodeaminase|nr:glutamate formimidoyltransferase [Nitrospira sp.]
MPTIIECIPNFSEGRDSATLEALRAAVRSVPGVWLLDHTSDPDHHRSVLTFAGEPEAVCDAALQAIRVATERIDLRRHEGVHPRIGATDVVPFVPLQDATIEDCIRLARLLGERVGQELQIPVFLYEQTASHPDRVRLESVRRGGLPGLRARMAADPNWRPDFGPSRLHETAGAIVIGARPPLIAFNVNLNTADLAIAKAIAKTVRQSSGGFPCIKALGVPLTSRGIVQVSMNLTDYRVTSMATAFRAVNREAAKLGVAIAGSELIGLVPQAALDQAAAALLQLDRFDPSSILETKLRAALSISSHAETGQIEGYLQAVAAPIPTPAGGSVAALVGALAASLGVMGARLGKEPAAEQRLIGMSRRLQRLVQEDCDAYKIFAQARALPVDHADRSTRLPAALQRITEVPLEIAELACEAGQVLVTIRTHLPVPVQSDLTVGLLMAIAAAEAGRHTANTNINVQQNHNIKDSYTQRSSKISNCLEELKRLCYTPPFVA